MVKITLSPHYHTLMYSAIAYQSCILLAQWIMRVSDVQINNQTQTEEKLKNDLTYSTGLHNSVPGYRKYTNPITHHNKPPTQFHTHHSLCTSCWKDSFQKSSAQLLSETWRRNTENYYFSYLTNVTILSI